MATMFLKTQRWDVLKNSIFIHAKTEFFNISYTGSSKCMIFINEMLTCSSIASFGTREVCDHLPTFLHQQRKCDYALAAHANHHLQRYPYCQYKLCSSPHNNSSSTTIEGRYCQPTRRHQNN